TRLKATRPRLKKAIAAGAGDGGGAADVAVPGARANSSRKPYSRPRTQPKSAPSPWRPKNLLPQQTRPSAGAEGVADAARVAARPRRRKHPSKLWSSPTAHRW